MKTKLSDVLRDVLQEDFFPGRSTVGREFTAEMLAEQKVFGNSTEVGARLNVTPRGRQTRLDLSSTRTA